MSREYSARNIVKVDEPGATMIGTSFEFDWGHA